MCPICGNAFHYIRYAKEYISRFSVERNRENRSTIYMHVFKAHGETEPERERKIDIKADRQIDRDHQREKELLLILKKQHDHDRISLNSSFEIIEIKSPIKVYTQIADSSFRNQGEEKGAGKFGGGGGGGGGGYKYLQFIISLLINFLYGMFPFLCPRDRRSAAYIIFVLSVILSFCL